MSLQTGLQYVNQQLGRELFDNLGYKVSNSSTDEVTMARSPRLVEALKKQLRHQSMNYRQLADALELSESAVKQMFASGNMSLKRLDAVCDVIGLEVSDLASLAESQEDKLESLTREQESELVDDIRFLLVAYCVVNHWKFDEIVSEFNVSEHDCVQYLAKLDRMKLVELLPGNRIKPLIAPNFNWQRNGPIERFFRKEVQGQFFANSFTEDGALRLVRNGYITAASHQSISDKLVAAAELFESTIWDERKKPVDQRHGTTMVLAIRQWEFSVFQEFIRVPDDADS